jgi:hypothetical protein
LFGSEQAVPAYFDFRLLLGFNMIGRVTQGPLFSNFGGQFGPLRSDQAVLGMLIVFVDVEHGLRYGEKNDSRLFWYP